MNRVAATLPMELLVWLSPAFPVGSFAYSHGLEWAAGTGRIVDRDSAQAWLADLLAHGGPRNDAILLAAAWRAACANDATGVRRVNALALALAGSRERYLETSAQGNAFMTTTLAAWSSDALLNARRTIDGDIAYPIAVGIATGARGLDLASTLTAFATASMVNLVSALVRLSVIGQTDGQRVLAALAPAIMTLAVEAKRATLDDLGGAALIADIAAIGHETQETRLFRT